VPGEVDCDAGISRCAQKHCTTGIDPEFGNPNAWIPARKKSKGCNDHVKALHDGEHERAAHGSACTRSKPVEGVAAGLWNPVERSGQDRQGSVGRSAVEHLHLGLLGKRNNKKNPTFAWRDKPDGCAESCALSCSLDVDGCPAGGPQPLSAKKRPSPCQFDASQAPEIGCRTGSRYAVKSITPVSGSAGWHGGPAARGSDDRGLRTAIGHQQLPFLHVIAVRHSVCRYRPHGNGRDELASERRGGAGRATDHRTAEKRLEKPK